MKKDALQKGLPVPDQAAVRERVLAKNVEAPDLATVKDFFRFCAATGKGNIVTKGEAGKKPQSEDVDRKKVDDSSLLTRTFQLNCE
jgi:hypothetical protein